MSMQSQVLVLEDEPLIALDVETLLNDQGLTNIQVFSETALAIEWLQKNKPGLAILDYYIKGTTSEGVAETLATMGVPFIICSAAQKGELSPAFANGHWVSKPYEDDQLISTALGLLEEQAADR